MKDLITMISERFSSKYAYITNDNEIYDINESELEDLRDKRIAELEATIKSMQEELKLLKDDNKSLKEVVNKHKRSESAKKAAKTRAERRAAADNSRWTPSAWGYGGCGSSNVTYGGC